MSLLEVQNLRKSFGKVEVIREISFSLEKGEVLVIIGSSGSGKTTLLRCLNFLETPSGGKLLLNGETLFDADSHEKISDSEIRKRRLHFGLVFQSFNLFPQYNVLKNVTLAAELLEKGKFKEEKVPLERRKERLDAIEANAKALLDKVGLSEKMENYPCQLSGGQCQRVAIARALALHPDILCFDEPTSALDPELTGEVLKVIKGLKGGDSTMIVVTHEMEFARAVADRVIYMADGVIEEMGTPDQVFGSPKSEKTKAFLSNVL